MSYKLYQIIQEILKNHPKYMSETKLHILSYYVQVNALVLNGVQAYPDKIYAGEKGPYIRSLNSYKYLGGIRVRIPCS